MTTYDTFCLRQGNMSHCGNSMVKMVGADIEKVNQCINSHFDTRDPSNCNSNRYFDMEAEAMAKDGVFYTPYININGMPFRVKRLFQEIF